MEREKLLASGNHITINNNVTISNNGLLDPDDELLKVGGDWNNMRGAAGFVEGSGTVEFFGSSIGSILSDETFNNLELIEIPQLFIIRI